MSETRTVSSRVCTAAEWHERWRVIEAEMREEMRRAGARTRNCSFVCHPEDPEAGTIRLEILEFDALEQPLTFDDRGIA
jgi:hypothetical protein